MTIVESAKEPGQVDSVVSLRPDRTHHSQGLHPGGARGVMVIVIGNGHGDTSSNPGRDWLHFT